MAKTKRTKVMQRNLIHYSLVCTPFPIRHELCGSAKEKSRLKVWKRWRRRAVNRTKYNQNIACNSTFVSSQFLDLCISGGRKGIFQQNCEMCASLLLDAKDLYCFTSYWKEDFSCSHCVLFIPQTKSFQNGQCEWMWRWLYIAYWANERNEMKRNGMKWTKGAYRTNACGKRVAQKSRIAVYLHLNGNEKKSKEHYIIDCSVPLKHYFWFSSCEISRSENGARKWSIGALLIHTHTNTSTANNWLFVANESLIHKHNALLCFLIYFPCIQSWTESPRIELMWKFSKQNKTNQNTGKNSVVLLSFLPQGFDSSILIVYAIHYTTNVSHAWGRRRRWSEELFRK